MPIDAYLELSGGEYPVAGETTDSVFKQKQAMEITSFKITATHPQTEADQEAPTDKSNVNITEIEVHKIIDNASPTLFLCCCEHVQFANGKLTFRKEGGGSKPFPYLTLDLTKVTVLSVEWNLAAESGGKDEETVKLAFGTIKVSYFIQAETGGRVAPNIKGWDLLRNAPL
jgi:type VI secretion system Hcp family effector